MEVFIAVLAFLAVAGVGVALTMSPQTEKSAKRARELVSNKPMRGKKDASAIAAAKRRLSVQDNLREMASQQKSSRRNLLSVKARLAQAGLSTTENTFWMISAISGGVLGVIAYVASGLSPIWGLAVFLIGGGLLLTVPTRSTPVAELLLIFATLGLPSGFATASAVARLSPVRRIVRRFMRCSSAMASAESGFASSVIEICPIISI